MTIVRDINDAGTIIGTLSFPDDTPEPEIAAALARSLAMMRATANAPIPDPDLLEAFAPPFLMQAGNGSTESRYPCGIVNATALGTGAPSANVLRLMPLWVSRTTTIDRASVNVTTGIAGNLRLGIYRTDPDAVRSGRFMPTKLVAQSANIDTAANGIKETTAPLTIPAGNLAWLALVSSAAPTIRTMGLAGCWPVFGLDNGLGTAPRVGLTLNHAFGPLPATFPSSGFGFITGTPVPAIFVRVAG